MDKGKGKGHIAPIMGRKKMIPPAQTGEWEGKNRSFKKRGGGERGYDRHIYTAYDGGREKKKEKSIYKPGT